MEVHPSDDGLVRSVTVKIGYNRYKRPITKIVLLEGDMFDEDTPHGGECDASVPPSYSPPRTRSRTKAAAQIPNP